MTKLETAERCRVTPALIDQLVRDETIPPHFVTKEGRAGKLIHLAPAAAAVVVLLQILQAAMGEQSPTPKKVVKALIPKIQQRWMNPQMQDNLVVDQELDGGDVLQVSIRPTFITRARELVGA
jgi:hypothetical protein